MRRFARDFGAMLLCLLTFFLAIAAAEGDVLSGWIVAYCAGMGVISVACLYVGFGDVDE